MLRILSCNIRKSEADDGLNSWRIRSDICKKVIVSRQADIICFQEMRLDQFHELQEALRGFSCYFLPKTFICRNPINAIFFRVPRFEVVASGGYWLSETPHIAGSSSWGSASIRLANWVVLKDALSGQIFRVINTHLDHQSQNARMNQALMIIDDTEYGYPPDMPHILTGDFNADRTNPVLVTLKEAGFTDSYEGVNGLVDPGFTYHKFEGRNYTHQGMGKIDWVMTRGSVKSLEASIVKETVNGCYPSDHYFLDAVFDIHHRLRENQFRISSLFSKVPL